jgi:hypothetical protein
MSETKSKKKKLDEGTSKSEQSNKTKKTKKSESEYEPVNLPQSSVYKFVKEKVLRTL